MSVVLIAVILAAAPAATPDFSTQPADRTAFCAHMHLHADGQHLDMDPGVRIDTNEFSFTISPGFFMYRNVDMFAWITDHCKGLLTPPPPPPKPGIPI